MTDRDRLVAGIIDNPNDVLRRLVFADWLSENGEDDFGDLIRVQCELAGTPRCRTISDGFVRGGSCPCGELVKANGEACPGSWNPP